jgi:hypothetical protein
MKLRVQKAQEPDIYRDTARIPEPCRITKTGQIIEEGKVCKVTARGQSIYLILRGRLDTNEEVIYLDERCRNRLGVSINEQVEFDLKPVRLFGEFRWAWSASDPAYRIAARLAVLSVVLGFLGIGLGIISVFK